MTEREINAETSRLVRPSFTRRTALFGSGALLLAAATPRLSHAQGRVLVTPGGAQALPIALPDFIGGTPSDIEVGRNVTQVITADLKRSGLFAPIDPQAYLERISNFDAQPRYADWRVINAQALVTGRMTRQPDGRLRAEFRLWDVFVGQQLTGQQYFTAPENWRRVAHIIADAIYERLTGDKGYFDTRIVFVDESGPKERRVKRLAVMDQDGANVRYLSRGDEEVITPRFSPSSQEITYMALSRGNWRVYLMNIETGQRESVGNFQGMTLSPRFSPDGQRVVFSAEQSGVTSIYAMDLRSKATSRLTGSGAIDIAPCYSPDGRYIVFASDRGGSAQLYVMGQDGSGQRRLSFGEGSYTTPVWSPRGDFIAFTKQYEGQFAIGVMRTDGSGERILTSGYHNEGPTWSPNGRVVMFWRDPAGGAGPQLFSVDLTGQNEQRVPTPNFASDPAWSPLLS